MKQRDPIVIMLSLTATVIVIVLVALSFVGCSTGKKIQQSTKFKSDSTAVTQSRIATNKVVTTDVEGKQTVIEYRFGTLTPELIQMGINAPPIESATVTTFEGRKSVTEQGDSVADVTTEISSVVDAEVDYSEKPAPDPYRWRWIFGIVVVIAIAGWWVYRKFFR